MNILTFDIEDWYNCDFISRDFNWDKYDVRIYEGTERILKSLEEKKIKGTFFCLGWIAEKHPKVVQWIHEAGHEIGCHSYKHELLFRFNPDEFKEDTIRAKDAIQNITGEDVKLYRAPGFSIKKENQWALEVLAEIGFTHDASIFPAIHDYGGFPDFGIAEPVYLKLRNGAILKEFPMSVHKLGSYSLVFSGGGFFRLFPYPLINFLSNKANYLMTYFHPRDFDAEQPILENLPFNRKFKSYVGLKSAFSKYIKYIDDFSFISIDKADSLIDWEQSRIIDLNTF